MSPSQRPDAWTMLHGKGDFAGVIKLSALRWRLFQTTWVSPITRVLKSGRERHKRTEWCHGPRALRPLLALKRENQGREPRNPNTIYKQEKARKRFSPTEGNAAQPTPWTWPAETWVKLLEFWWICIVLSHSVCGNWWQQSQELTQFIWQIC